MAPLLLSVARRNTAKIAATADDVERAVRAGLAAGLAAATAADVVDGLLKQGSENLMEKAESAFAVAPRPRRPSLGPTMCTVSRATGSRAQEKEKKP